MSGGRKKAVDHFGGNQKEVDRVEAAKGDVSNNQRGVAGGQLREPLPLFLKAACEHVITGQNNSAIVLGRDRPGSRLSGYGGLGDTQCGMIDLCVGRMGSSPMSVDPDGNQIWTDPNVHGLCQSLYFTENRC